MKIVPTKEIPVALPVQLENLIDIYNTCLQMQKICEQEKGIGISAVQVGLPLQLFLIKDGDKYRYFLNCTYESFASEASFISVEGCLSLPNRIFKVLRFPSIRVVGKELVFVLNEGQNELQIINYDNIHADNLSIVFQHEIDHFLGNDGLVCNLKNSEEIFLEPYYVNR